MDLGWLFPFEKVPYGSKILIYGAGALGQSYLAQIEYTNYCEVIGFVDRNYEKYKYSFLQVHSPAQINELFFDYVVIAVKFLGSLPEIRRILEENGIEKERIIFVGKRKRIDYGAKAASFGRESHEVFAFERGGLSVGLFLISAMGGVLFLKKFVEAIIEIVPECLIDIYSTSQVKAINIFYSDLNNINSVMYNLGTKYGRNKNRYSLALTVNASGFLKIDGVNRGEIEKISPRLMAKIEKLQHIIDEERYDDSTPRIAIFQDRKYHNKNCYTAFDYNVFNIHDKKVAVPINKEYESIFTKIGIKRYITVNYGNGSCKDGSKIAKMWPLENFNKLVHLFKKQYPSISIVQLGTSDAERIDGVDRNILGEPFELVIHILKNSILHIDIEGGLVHLATQLGTKCAVLFGPTPEFYYGYEENINIKVGDGHDCCGVYMDSNRCARGMEKPECMYSITPEIVMERVKEHLKFNDTFSLRW